MKIKTIVILGALFLFGLGSYFYSNYKSNASIDLLTAEKIDTDNPYVNSKIQVTTFQSDDKTWGYDISIDGVTYVHQPTIPAVSGNIGFSSKEDAHKTAEFVVSKIKNNEMPPSITPEELKELGIQ